MGFSTYLELRSALTSAFLILGAHGFYMSAVLVLNLNLLVVEFTKVEIIGLDDVDFYTYWLLGAINYTGNKCLLE